MVITTQLQPNLHHMFRSEINNLAIRCLKNGNHYIVTTVTTGVITTGNKSFRMTRPGIESKRSLSAKQREFVCIEQWKSISDDIR